LYKAAFTRILLLAERVNDSLLKTMTAIREYSPSVPPCRYPLYNGLEEEGCYYFNARWYDAQTGRFLSEDPARDGANWYIYCSNNPIKYIDPSGMWDSSGSANDNPYDEGGDATRGDNTNAPRGPADDGGGSKEPKPEYKDKPEKKWYEKGLWKKWRDAKMKRRYKDVFDGIIPDNVVDKLIKAGISANDLFSGVTGLVAKNPQILSSLKMMPEVSETFTPFSSVASGLGITIAMVDFNKSLNSGDIGSIAYNLVTLGVSTVSYNNPAIGLGSFYVENTYGVAIVEMATAAANVNISYNNDPVGFMISFYSIFGGNPNFNYRR